RIKLAHPCPFSASGSLLGCAFSRLGPLAPLPAARRLLSLCSARPVSVVGVVVEYCVDRDAGARTGIQRTYQWDSGDTRRDSSGNQGTGASVFHCCIVPGQCLATWTVLDNRGRQGMISKTLPVDPLTSFTDTALST